MMIKFHHRSLKNYHKIVSQISLCIECHRLHRTMFLKKLSQIAKNTIYEKYLAFALYLEIQTYFN